MPRCSYAPIVVALAFGACVIPPEPPPPPPPVPIAAYQLTAEDVRFVVDNEKSLAEQRAAREHRHRSIGEVLAATGRVSDPITEGQAAPFGDSPSVESLLASQPNDLARYRQARARIDALEQMHRDHVERLSLVLFRTTNLQILRATRLTTADPAAQAQFDAAIAEVERSVAAAQQAEAAFAVLEPEWRLLIPYRQTLFGARAGLADGDDA